MVGVGNTVLAVEALLAPTGAGLRWDGGVGEQGLIASPIAPQMVTSGGGGGGGPLPGSQVLREPAGPDDSGGRGHAGAQVLPRAQRSVGTCPSSSDTHASITGQA